MNYIGLGPFRFTSTKKNLSPVLGIDGYRNALQACKQEGIELPIIAIGGILPADVKGIMGTGVAGIAIASAVNLAEDREAAFRHFAVTLASADKLR